MPHLPGIAEVNAAASTDAFARAIGLLFEDAAPVAGPLAARRPFGSWEELLDAAGEVIASLPYGEKLRLLRAHPRIGERPERLRRRSALSYAEQGGDVTDAAVDARLAELNTTYEVRHGFPFVEFVAGRPRAALVEVLARRLQRPTDQELAAGLDAVLAIARDRLTKLRAED